MGDPTIEDVTVTPSDPLPGGSAMVSVTVQENGDFRMGESCVYSLWRAGVNIDVEVYVEGSHAGSDDLCIPIYLTKNGTATADVSVDMADTTPTQELVVIARGGFTGTEYDRVTIHVDVSESDDGQAMTIARVSSTDVADAGDPVRITGDVCCTGFESCQPDTYTYRVDGEVLATGDVFAPSGCEPVIDDQVTFDETGDHTVGLHLAAGIDDTHTISVTDPADDGGDDGDDETPDRRSLLPVAAAGGAFLLLGGDDKENEPRDLPP